MNNGLNFLLIAILVFIILLFVARGVTWPFPSTYSSVSQPLPSEPSRPYPSYEPRRYYNPLPRWPVYPPPPRVQWAPGSAYVIREYPRERSRFSRLGRPFKSLAPWRYLGRRRNRSEWSDGEPPPCRGYYRVERRCRSVAPCVYDYR